ncbi:nucleotidyltransferase family protein [Microbulbifer taiwanensis]|uniref:NTP transferase domain-containing protein n=1 Tax=Microbulbifer taiwanensis TaxID=986746 RepID=A0ABW1YI54_9GAMM|nr:nucleotidyltransferase family protein [Microbulbifer taiwanensis]
MADIQPIILAAGASSRFGACKLLLEHGGRTLLQHCVDKLVSLDLPTPLIVSGAWHAPLVDAHPGLDLRQNRDWRAGMGSSLAFGIRQLQADCEAALIVLADQPAVTGADIRSLLDTWKENRNIVCSFYENRRGVPAIFPRSVFAQLAILDGDRGARELLRGPRDDITSVPLASAVIDIDTPQDWKNFGESR